MEVEAKILEMKSLQVDLYESKVVTVKTHNSDEIFLSGLMMIIENVQSLTTKIYICILNRFNLTKT